MKNILALFFLAGVLFSCSERRVQGVVAGDEPAHVQTMDSLFEDTTKVLNVHLPSLVDSARQILVHEIYLETRLNLDDRSYSKKEYIGGQINIANLIFENVINQKKHLLTDNQIRISFYHQLQDKKENRYFLYRVIDRDYNKDGKMNSDDVESLYISNIDGTSFSKLTKDKENVQYNDKAWIHSIDRYYFTTLKDSDKNGSFDPKDEMHHYYIQFNSGGYNVVEYNPLEILKK